MIGCDCFKQIFLLNPFNPCHLRAIVLLSLINRFLRVSAKSAGEAFPKNKMAAPFGTTTFEPMKT